MAPTPAPMPATSARRRSTASSPSRSAMTEPMPPEICAAGPSLPAAPPVPIVIAEAVSFTGMTRIRMRAPRLWKASITWSAPAPSASGASE